jgi:hypothetical protein
MDDKNRAASPTVQPGPWDTANFRPELGNPSQTCPHCKTVIPFAAHVCTGCHAERHNGPTGEETKGLAGIGCVAGFLIGRFVMDLSFVHSLALMLAGGFAGAVLAQVAYQKTRWLRVYTTQQSRKWG